MKDSTGPRKVLSPDNLRCRICNVVSHGDISGDFGDHSQSAFYSEEDGLGFLCHECYSGYTAVLDDYAIEDEFDEYDDDFHNFFDGDFDD